MSYQRLKAYNFGIAYAGALANAGYSLAGDTAWSPAAEVLDPTGDPTGGVQATVTFPDGYAGVLLWCPDTTATPKRYAFVEVNPGDDERTDGKISAVPAAVWSNGTRTLTAFGFQVTVSGFGTGGPTFRNQDGVTSPTWDDCLASAWAASNAREVENDADLTWVRYLPNGVDPMRSFVLTADANGNPVGRS